MPAPVMVALVTTSALLTWLLCLGASLQMGWRKQQARWMHHALFIAVIVGVLVLMALAWRAGLVWWFLLPSLALLLTMPITHPGRNDHWQRALMCAAAYVLGVFLLWR